MYEHRRDSRLNHRQGRLAMKVPNFLRQLDGEVGTAGHVAAKGVQSSLTLRFREDVHRGTAPP